MKRISFALAAALALAVNACEKHSAEETSSALHTTHDAAHDAGHADTAHEGATQSKAAEHAKPQPEPLTPNTIPANPSGSAPTDTHDPNKDKGTGGSGDPGAYKYFPNSGKK